MFFMSDAHGADSHGHGTGHEASHTESHGSLGGNPKECRTDPFFTQVSNYVTGKIAAFVAFLFVLILLGELYALVVLGVPIRQADTALLIAPAIIGLIAYYNRDVAIALFALLILGAFLI